MLPPHRKRHATEADGERQNSIHLAHNLFEKRQPTKGDVSDESYRPSEEGTKSDTSGTTIIEKQNEELCKKERQNAVMEKEI